MVTGKAPSDRTGSALLTGCCLIKKYVWRNRGKNLSYMSGKSVRMRDSLHSLESDCKESRAASLSLMKDLRTTEALRKYPD